MRMRKTNILKRIGVVFHVSVQAQCMTWRSMDAQKKIVQMSLEPP